MFTHPKLTKIFLQSSAFSKKKKEKRKGWGEGRNSQWLSPRQTAGCASPSLSHVFPGCDVQLKAVLRIG
jgi:hypothetical protein